MSIWAPYLKKGINKFKMVAVGHVAKCKGLGEEQVPCSEAGPDTQRWPGNTGMHKDSDSS